MLHQQTEHTEIKEVKEAKEKEIKALPSILQELKEEKIKLMKIWKEVMPFYIDLNTIPPKLRNRHIFYLMEEELISTGVAGKNAEEEKNIRDRYNPFHLNVDQHKHFMTVLSILIQIIDNMEENVTKKRKEAPYAIHNRNQLFFMQVYFLKFHKEIGIGIGSENIPIHAENFARIKGKKKDEEKEAKEKVLKKIPAGEPRARAILISLVRPFIYSYQNLKKSPEHLQEFCNKLKPANEFACCIDARTRDAYLYGLSTDLETPRFTQLLQDVVNKTPPEKSDSYFYLLATLVKYHWGKVFQADTGEFGIFKPLSKPEIPFDPAHPSAIAKLTAQQYEFIFKGFNSIAHGMEINNDFLMAYSMLPQPLLFDFFRVALKQKDFFNSFKLNHLLDIRNFNILMLHKYHSHSFFYFIAVECNELDIAKKFILYTSDIVLEKTNDIWIEPLFSKTIGDLEVKDLAVIIEKIDCDDFLILKKLIHQKSQQLLDFFHEKFCKKPNEIDNLNFFRDAAIIKSLFFILEHAQINDALLQKQFDELINLSIHDNFNQNNVTNLIASALYHLELDIQHDIFNKISNHALPDVIKKMRICSFPPSFLSTMYYRLENENPGLLLEVAKACNIFSSPHIEKHLIELINLLSKKLNSEQIFSLIMHSSVWHDVTLSKEKFSSILFQVINKFSPDDIRLLWKKLPVPMLKAIKSDSELYQSCLATIPQEKKSFVFWLFNPYFFTLRTSLAPQRLFMMKKEKTEENKRENQIKNSIL